MRILEQDRGSQWRSLFALLVLNLHAAGGPQQQRAA